MERWKSRGGNRQRREKKKREDQRRGKVRRKKMQVREKVETWRLTVFFQWFVALEGRKVGSLKPRVRGHLARWEMKNCTRFWREAHLEVKLWNAHHVRTTVWTFRCRKSARRFGAKHVSKSKYTKHRSVATLLEVEVSKKCTPLWREAQFQVKPCKTHQLRSTFWSWEVEKVHAVVARNTFGSQNVQGTPCSEHFWTFRCGFAWQAQGILHLGKSEQTWSFYSMSKNDGKRRAFEVDLERCISRGRRSTKDMFIRDVRRSGRRFPERGCSLEHQIRSSGLLRRFCVTHAALRMTWHHFFVAGAIL